MQMIPAVICKKEDAVNVEDVDYNVLDKSPEEVAAMTQKIQDNWARMIGNEPQIKMVLAGSMLELIEKGVVEMDG